MCMHTRMHMHMHVLTSRVFSQVTLTALAKVLQRSAFYVMISSRAPKVWWGCGLAKVQPVAKMRFVTTGRERCTVYIYINAQVSTLFPGRRRRRKASRTPLHPLPIDCTPTQCARPTQRPPIARRSLFPAQSPAHDLSAGDAFHQHG